MEKTTLVAEDINKDISSELAKILADEYVLTNKTRYAQWHIDSPDYYTVHKTFETQFERLENFITSIAKRIGLFGHYVPPASPSFLTIAHLKNTENVNKDCKAFLMELLADHEILIESLKDYMHRFYEEYHDTETGDFIGELKKGHEQIVGLLQSHL